MGGPAGMSYLFRSNPYENRSRGIREILPNSGYARPLLMGEMGKQARQAEEFDTEKASTLSDIYQRDQTQKNEQALMKDADETFKIAADVAKHDPIAATQLIQAKAKGNKYLEPMKDITFRRTFDGKSVVEIKDAKGAQRGIINATDMLEEANAAEQQKGTPLTDEERTGLTQKYFYPTPGYEKPEDKEEGTHKVGDVREFFKKGSKGESLKGKQEYQGKNKGWMDLGDFVPEHAPKDGEGGEGRVKATDSKALKIELARKYVPLAKRQLQEKAAKAVGPEFQKIKDQIDRLDALLSKRDPLTNDFNADAVYAALPEEMQGAFDRIFLDAENALPRTGKVAAAVNDAISGYHKGRKAATPAKPASPAGGGADWKKYLKR